MNSVPRVLTLWLVLITCISTFIYSLDTKELQENLLGQSTGFLRELIREPILGLRLAKEMPGALSILALKLHEKNHGLTKDILLLALSMDDTRFRGPLFTIASELLQKNNSQTGLLFLEEFLETLVPGKKTDPNFVFTWESIGQILGPQNDVVPALGLLLLKNGKTEDLEKIYSLVSQMVGPTNPPHLQAFLEFEKSELWDLFMARVDLLKSNESPPESLIRVLLSRPSNSLQKGYFDLLSNVQGGLLVLSQRLHTMGLGRHLETLRLYSSTQLADQVVDLIQMKQALIEKKYPLAFQSWKTFEDQGGLRWLEELLVQYGKTSETPFLGIIRDIFDGGRLSGRVGETAKILVDLSTIFKAEGRIYTLELAGRLYHSLGQNQDAFLSFRESYSLAGQLFDNGLLTQQDHQRILWYFLRAQLTVTPEDFTGILGTLSQINDPSYFDDLLEGFIIDLAQTDKWSNLEILTGVVGQILTPRLRNKVRSLLARHLDLSKQDGSSLWNQVYEQSANLYYHAMAGYFTGKEIQVSRVLTAQGTTPIRGRQDLRDSDDPTVDLYLRAMDYGFIEWATQKLQEIRSSLTPSILDKVGVFLYKKGRISDALTSLDTRRSRFGHPRDREVLEAMYPIPMDFGPLIIEKGEGNGIPRGMFFSLLRTESHFDPSARSHAGAQGLAQFMPSTARATAQSMGLVTYDVYKPMDAIAMAGYHLAELRKSQDNWSKVLGAYNAGPGRMRSVTMTLPKDQFLFNELLKITETRDYIRRIIESSLVYGYLYQPETGYHDLVAGFLGGAATE